MQCRRACIASDQRGQWSVRAVQNADRAMFAKKHSDERRVNMRIIVEAPPKGWITNPEDGHRHKEMFSNLIVACLDVFDDVQVAKTRSGLDTLPRTAGPNECRIAFHSRGVSRNVWHLKEAPIPPYYSLDRTGFSGWSEIANNELLQQAALSMDIETANAVLEKQRSEFLRTKLSKYSQPTGRIDIKNYIFHPTQVLTDPVAELAYVNNIDLIEKLAECAKKFSRNVVIKRHPLCKSNSISEFLKKIEKTNPYVHIINANIHDLIMGSDCVVVINSGVGLEAIFHGKPVYAAGKSEYSFSVNEIHSISDVEAIFMAKEHKKAKKQAQVAAYMLSYYWINSTNISNIVNRLKKIRSDAEERTSNELSLNRNVDNNEILKLNVRLEEVIRENLGLKSELLIAKKMLVGNKLLHSFNEIIHSMLSKLQVFK